MLPEKVEQREVGLPVGLTWVEYMRIMRTRTTTELNTLITPAISKECAEK